MGNGLPYAERSRSPSHTGTLRSLSLEHISISRIMPRPVPSHSTPSTSLPHLPLAPLQSYKSHTVSLSFSYLRPHLVAGGFAKGAGLVRWVVPRPYDETRSLLHLPAALPSPLPPGCIFITARAG